MSDYSYGEGIIPKSNFMKLEKLSYYLLLAFVFLLPIFFVPSVLFSFQFGKVALVSIVSLVSLCLFIISRLKIGNIEIPKHLAFSSIVLVLVINAISVLLSGSIMESFVGTGVETDTLFFTIILFTLLFSAFKVFNSTERILGFYVATFASSVLLLAYHLLRVAFGPSFLSFGLLTAPTSNLLGSWNDLSVLFGLLIMVSSVFLEFLKPTKVLRALLYVFVALSLVLLAVVNSLNTWVVLAVASLLLFIYIYFQNKKGDDGRVGKKFSNVAALVFAVSVILLILRPQVGEFVLSKFNISQIEARPSVSSTVEIAKNVLAKNPGFGVGPNRFSVEWGESKPLAVNNTIFWNVDFNYGIGIVPTYLITNGILGFLAWLAFIVSIVLLGVKAMFMDFQDSNTKFLSLSSFFGTAYLWAFSIFSIPSVSIVALTFIVTGVFLASMAKAGLIRNKEISFSDDSKTSFASVFVMIVVFILSLGLLYIISARYVSSVYAQKAVSVVNQNGDLNGGLLHMSRAISLAKTDDNYRLLSELHVARLNDLLQKEDVSKSQAGIARFQDILGAAISSSQLAINQDQSDYRNWLSLAGIYEAIIPLGINGAYDNAKKTYEKAMDVNPTNPAIDLGLARIEVMNNNSKGARELIGKSLAKKSNYTSAIFLLSQIEINEGNIREAIQAVESASLIDPNDPLTFFQLGFLKFSQRDYQGAVNALERAVILNPPYSNAKYFLGLSYYFLDRNEEAVAQFEDIEMLNPDNQEVKDILLNLRAGKNPLPNTPQNNEGTEELPLQES
jgi:tetratricopeptide (TPR) repeat protein